jgi:hypothetical protein
MTPRRPRLVWAAAGVTAILLHGVARAQPASPAEGAAIDAAVESYRTGPPEPAIVEFNRLVGGPAGHDRLIEWAQTAARDGRTAVLEAALLLCSESIVKAWIADDVYPGRILETHLRPLDRLHLALRKIDPRTRFLRVWYLFWESFRQGNVHEPMPAAADFLDEAIAAFPRDSQLLLAAGARNELLWRVSLNNAQRDPRGESARVKRYLIDARGWLQRSLAADPKESEARLRLGRVSLDLDDLDGAAKALTGFAWKAEGPAFEYLALLFEGELHERRGDPGAAAAAYDRAISLTTVPQSAQMARAHLAHRLGSRPEAARVVMEALSRKPVEQSDPWWLYIRGGMWRTDYYYRVARSLVRPAASPPRTP